MRVTVFGATGVLGRALVPLLAGEHDVVAVSRRPGEHRAGIRWVEADAASGEGRRRGARGAEVAYYLVHSLGARDFERQDREAAENVSREAAQAGVQQIVYLGGLGGDSLDASPHLRSRQETGERLGSDGVPVTTLRAAMVIGKGSAAFETILGLVKRLPVMITPSWVSTPTQPIALEDIARYLAGVCGNDAAIGEGFDAGGAEVMTYRQMIERIAAATRPATTHHRGPRAHPSAVGAMARARHTRQRLRRPPARRRPSQPNRGARGATAAAAPLRAHVVRAVGAAGTRNLSRETRFISGGSRCSRTLIRRKAGRRLQKAVAAQLLTRHRTASNWSRQTCPALRVSEVLTDEQATAPPSRSLVGVDLGRGRDLHGPFGRCSTASVAASPISFLVPPSSCRGCGVAGCVPARPDRPR